MNSLIMTGGRRTGRRTGDALLPFGLKKKDKLELPGQVGALALGTDWIAREHVYDIAAHMMLAEKIARWTHEADLLASIQASITALASIEARIAKTGRVGTTGPELTTLRDTLAVTLPWVSAQPNRLIADASHVLLKQFDQQAAERGRAA